MKIIKAFVFALLTCSAIAGFALTAEQRANIACEEYTSLGKKKYPSEQFLSCSILNRSAGEWECMKEKHINKGWNYIESTSTCFKSAPALAITQKAIQEQDRSAEKKLSDVRPSHACKAAYAIFSEHGEKIGVTEDTLCNMTERNTAMWICMATLGEEGNSYNFSVGQCFPRYKS